ncbi:MAG: hypothetical protein GQ557_01860 [Mycoplasmataceae bacterium]|nr:hypothetical protein [Mycoplasmataceae bacterium]
MNKFSFKYLNFYLSGFRKLNVENIEKLTKNEIITIGKLYNREDFLELKKSIFWKWHNENIEYTDSYIKKLIKLKNKLELEFDSNDNDYIKCLREKQFTKIRTLKTLEVPYETNKFNIQPFAFFAYGNIRYYDLTSNEGLKLMFRSELFISANEIVFFDRENNKINKIVKRKQITNIELLSYALLIKTKERDFYLRTFCDEVIYISLERLWKKSKIKFADKDSKKERNIYW